MQQVWRNRWRNTSWIALGAITLVLLVAAMHKKDNKVCNGIEVVFNGDGNNFFIDEKGVAAVLKANGVEKGLEIEHIDLKFLENRLKNDKWIKNAELFFDNNQVLKALIEEKEPVARVFTINGSSFYIDSACRKLPLSEKLSARIPMFTSFPSDRQNLSKPDSELLASIKDLAVFIQADEFWKAQVAQVDITPAGFEIIPTVGNHVVAFGKGNDYQQKFDRLFSFYKQVWTKVGFERYEKINVQYKGQVVATVKGAKSSIAVDSTKAKEVLEKLLATGKPVVDSMPAVVSNAPVVINNNVAFSRASIRDSARNTRPTTQPVTAPVARPAAVRQQVVRPPVVNARPKPVVPRATLPKPTARRQPVSTVLTAEEEALRREAIRQQQRQTRRQ